MIDRFVVAANNQTKQRHHSRSVQSTKWYNDRLFQVSQSDDRHRQTIFNILFKLCFHVCLFLCPAMARCGLLTYCLLYSCAYRHLFPIKIKTWIIDDLSRQRRRNSTATVDTPLPYTVQYNWKKKELRKLRYCCCFNRYSSLSFSLSIWVVQRSLHFNSAPCRGLHSKILTLGLLLLARPFKSFIYLFTLQKEMGEEEEGGILFICFFSCVCLLSFTRYYPMCDVYATCTYVTAAILRGAAQVPFNSLGGLFLLLCYHLIAISIQKINRGESVSCRRIFFAACRRVRGRPPHLRRGCQPSSRNHPANAPLVSAPDHF